MFWVSSKNSAYQPRSCYFFQDSGIVYATKSEQKIIPDEKVLSVEYHIIYSVSYQVPVLYLRVYDQNGRIFSDPEKVFEILSNPEHVDHLKSIKWEALTQQPHPLFQVFGHT
jgi:ubiquitin-like-conjugating enzyme ATG10